MFERKLIRNAVTQVIFNGRKRITMVQTRLLYDWDTAK